MSAAAHHHEVACSDCNMRELCMPSGLTSADMKRLDTLITSRKKCKAGDTLFRLGDSFTNLYAIRSGFFKTLVQADDGREQVTGFLMAGEILGLDGIGQGRHAFDAVALEDSEVCTIPYSRLDELTREISSLQHNVHRIMSREIVRDHGVMMMLGSMKADERVAVFLTNLLQRMSARGFSASDVVLRMSRQEIASYLGLTVETISRTLGRFADEGILAVKQKQVSILNPDLLKLAAANNCHV
jgi:CRP/FNR family transcriptional regulator, anaerobic regulatory protein